MSKRTKQPKPVQPPWTPLPFLAALLLVALALIAYAPALSGHFIWDDDDYVHDNVNLRTTSGLVDIWAHPTRSPQYYPMVFTTFWAEYQAWGAKPSGYHVNNVLLHAASAILFWRVLRRLKVPGAYFAALIFLVHPVMVESVAWITERKNTLSLLLYLASLDVYLRFKEQETPPNWRLYGLSLGLFLLALLSKSVTASLPAAIALILWWKHGRVRARDWALLAPFFVIGVLAGLGTASLESSHVGASGPEWNYSPAQRVLIAGRAVWFYVGKLAWPARLTFVYPKWPVDPAALWQWMFPAAVILVIALLFAVRRRIGPGPLVAVLFFVGTLVPALGFVNVYPMRYTFVADHYQYHATLGLITLFAAGAATVYHRTGFACNARIAALCAAVVAVPLLGLTWHRAGVYKNQKILWTDTLAKDPNSWMAWTNLGHVAGREDPPDRAAAADAYRRALALAPNVADTHFNVGQLYLNDDKYAAAESEFRRAIDIEPKYTDAYNMLGFSLRRMNRTDDAIPQFKKAIELNPQHWRALFNLGRAYKDQGKLPEAAAEFQKSLEVNPYQTDAYFHLADCLRQMGRIDLAIVAMEELLKLQPQNAQAHMNVAGLLRSVGRTGEANLHRARALAIDPKLER